MVGPSLDTRQHIEKDGLDLLKKDSYRAFLLDVKLPAYRAFPVRNMLVLYCAPYPAYKAMLAGALPVMTAFPYPGD